jgi:hypothetical protein
MDNRSPLKLIILTSVSTIVLLLVLGVGGYFLYSKFGAPWFIAWQEAEQSRKILAQVGKVVLLPPDEKPQVSTILDAEEIKASGQFFANAQVGDAVVLYPESGMLILFDLKNNKLLNMGTVATSTPDAPNP